MNSKNIINNQESLSEVSGETNFGTELEGIKNGHLVFRIDANNESDSFNFISKNTYKTNEYKNIMSLKSNGKIGINNNNPEYNLDINGSLRIKDENTKSTINFLDNDGTLGSKLVYKNDCINFTNKNDEDILTLGGDFDKNIGINTNNPTNKLDINRNSIRLRLESAEPDKNTIGHKGEIRWNTDNIFICLGIDGLNYKWKKAPLF